MSCLETRVRHSAPAYRGPGSDQENRRLCRRWALTHCRLSFRSAGACINRDRGIDATATREARIAPPMHKEDARMADQGKEKPSGRKTEYGQRTPGMTTPSTAPAPRMRQRAPALTKAELRAQADQ